MKALVASVFALSMLGATAADARISVRLGARPHHHRHRVCTYRHHHRVCFWR